MPDPVDLRSDTITRPTPAMRRAMAEAEVGDDVYREDPTVNALEAEAARRFGREAALFVPSGTMGNQVSLRSLAEPGTEVVVEAGAHIVNYEAGAHAVLGGYQFRTLAAPRGILDADHAAEVLRPRMYGDVQRTLFCVEQTTNRGGGTIYPLDTLDELRKLTSEQGMQLFMDGARVFNAAVAAGVEVAEYGRRVDALSFCVSKGLGAPVGSVVVGDREVVERARGWRHRYGGAMRQAGVLAAAGLYALEHHVDRLAEDHEHARMIATVIAESHPEAVDPQAVETNIVYVDTGDADAVAIAGELAEDGVLVLPMGPHLLRLLTHLDVDRDGCRRAAELIARRLGEHG